MTSAEAARIGIRASCAVFTALVLLLIQSAFWSDRVSAWMRLIIVATGLLSYFRPHHGLLALAALTPLGQVGSRTLDSSMRGAEALVLAFLAGALVRGWTLREFRTFPSTRLHVAALVFGFVVAASCVEQLWFFQILQDFPWTYMRELLIYASRDYLTSFREFDMLFRALLLLEGLALLLFTVRYAREHPQFSERLVVAIVTGAAATAVLTVWHVADELMETGAVRARLVDFFASQRWAVHIGDVNAAGSYFALTTFVAAGMAFKESNRGIMWLAPGVLLLLVMLMTGSRTAVAAAGLVGIFVLLQVAVSHSSYAIRALGCAAAVALVLAAAYLVLRTTGATPSQALSIRWAFLRTTGAMLAAHPLFGVGIGQYAASAEHFGPAELFTLWHPDNAHNNFAQIAGELGAAGFACLLAVLAVSLWRRGTEPRSGLFIPVLLALSAFIFTWLGGHPLLVPEVAYPFWITLGVAAALVASDSRWHWSAGVVAAATAILVVSIPFRVGAKSAGIDFARVSYGVSAKQLMTSRARFFVPAGTSRVEFPLRSRTADDDEPVEIEVRVDGVTSESITLSDPNWRRAPINLRGGSSHRFHQIDLQIKPGILDNIDPDRRSVEVGKWEIISKPNG
ncbi:MAG TPA: O-antigen ligase family protein [Vicinamibacterales bacterium]|nr:O-antigen ligase family protein [Vicinamibacterales bacterium]